MSETRLTLVQAVPEPLRGFRITDVTWLQTFYPWIEEHDDWHIELRTVEDGPQPLVTARMLHEEGEIATLIRQHREQVRGRDVRTPRLLWRLQPQDGNRPGGKAAACVALGCRIECADWTSWPLDERPRAIWEALHGCPAPPSVATWTGDAFEAWWLLQQPLQDVGRGDEVGHAIGRCLQTARRGSGFFHWPHTVNGRPHPHSVQVVWWQPAQRFSPDELHRQFGVIGEHEARRARFLRLLPLPARMMWGSIPMGATPLHRPALNLALASTLLLHGADRTDFETVAGMAPWNVEHTSAATELDLCWRHAQGASTSSQPVHAEIKESAAQATPAADADLPGLLLHDLPETAWTEWARLYRAAVGACTEAADELHYAALMTVLGAAFARNVVVHSGRPLYLNMYTVLVGPTGDRKTTAAQLALDLLPRIRPETLLINGVGSQEGLMERMATQQHANPTLWFVDELASLLKKARRESSGGLLELITEFFHCPDFKTHATRLRALHLSFPTLTILGGSTPAWLEGAMQQDDILGGFSNRFVYVVARPKPDNPLPSRPDDKALQELTAWARQAVQAPPRELTMAAKATDMWHDFYLEWRRTTTTICSDQVAALLRRIDLYILKFAALAAAMDRAQKITPAHLGQAIDLGRYLAGCAYRVLGDLGASSDVRLEGLVERKLREAQGQMRRKQLRQAIGGRVTGEKLDRVLAAMERNGLICQVDDRTDKASKLVQLT